MCGIIGVVVNKDHRKLIKNLYEIFVNQQSRGVMGAGISIQNSGDLFRFRTVSPFRLFNVYNYWVWRKVKQGSRIMIHHRTPTSTANLIRCNHPIANEDGTIHLIHNGVVSNDDKLYKNLKKNHTFETIESGKRFTDSEVIVHVFEESYKDGDVVSALKEVYHQVNGSYALAFMLKDDENIYLMRNWNPIEISKDEQGNFYFSSELNRFDTTLTHEHTLEDGEIGKLTTDGYVKLDKIDIPVRKARQATLYNERSWDDDDEKVVSQASPVSYGDDDDSFTDGYGHTIIRKGDYWVEREKELKRGYDYG